MSKDVSAPPPDLAELIAQEAEARLDLEYRHRECSDPYADRVSGAALSARDAAAHRMRAARAAIEAAKEARLREIKRISARARELGIDAETLRASIRRITGGRTDSRGQMTAPERAALVGELGRGAGSRRARGGPKREELSADGMLAKIGALLADQRLPWSYADAILRRQRGILDTTITCPVSRADPQEMRAVIAALARRKSRAAAQAVPA